MSELKEVKVLGVKDREKSVILKFSVKKTEETVKAINEIVAKTKTLVTITVA